MPNEIDALVRTYTGLGPRPRVLVADDVAWVRRSLRTILERAGFEVVEVESGEEAVREARCERFDVVLMDLEMGGIRGTTACTSIKRFVYPDRPPVIMLTAVPAHEAGHEAVRASADGYLEKPFRAEAVLREVDRCLARGIVARRAS